MQRVPPPQTRQLFTLSFSVRIDASTGRVKKHEPSLTSPPVRSINASPIAALVDEPVVALLRAEAVEIELLKFVQATAQVSTQNWLMNEGRRSTAHAADGYLIYIKPTRFDDPTREL